MLDFQIFATLDEVGPSIVPTSGVAVDTLAVGCGSLSGGVTAMKIELS
jgi:hypothetical protein